MKLFLMFLIIFSQTAYACKFTGKVNRNFIATSAIPFAKLMDQAMDIMDADMTVANSEKKSEAQFLKMMIAHHQGAVDMAHAILAHSKDEKIKNYAISIISSQKNEIDFMKALLKGK